MHIRSVSKVVGSLLLLVAAAQLIPGLLALYQAETGWQALLFSAVLSGVVGWILLMFGGEVQDFSLKDGFLAVTLSWIAASIAGAIPYWISGALPSFTDAIFESVSGFTTTGATVLEDYSLMGKGMLLWRSLTQWLGGMGIIVLGLVVLPNLRGGASMQLYQREAPGPFKDKLTPRLQDTARILWSVYLLFTLLEIAVLLLLGMTPFDALNHGLTNISTGGFSTRPESIAAWNSPAIEWAMIFFMFVGAVNFSLHYRLLTSRKHRLQQLRDEELGWYALACIAAFLLMTVYLYQQNIYASWQELVTKAGFQTMSILSSSGFTSADYVAWGAFAELLILALMLPGGCAGSTSGGIKWMRVILLLKNIRREIIRLAHPRAVVDTRFNEAHVDKDVLHTIYSFVLLFLASIALLTLLLTLSGLDAFTSLGAAVSAVSNIGPAVGSLGPGETYASLSIFAKWSLMLGMLAGRLEIMTVFMLFTAYFWRR